MQSQVGRAVSYVPWLRHSLDSAVGAGDECPEKTRATTTTVDHQISFRLYIVFRVAEVTRCCSTSASGWKTAAERATVD